MNATQRPGIDVDALAGRLQDEGVKARGGSWNAVMGVMASRSATVAKASCTPGQGAV